MYNGKNGLGLIIFMQKLKDGKIWQVTELNMASCRTDKNVCIFL